MKLEYFFDFSCPYAYLGSTQVEKLAKEHGAELTWKPFLLGGVFRELGTPMNLAKGQLPAKTRHASQDMQRWAKLWNVPLVMPASHPMRTVRALRTVLACSEPQKPALIHALFKAYWVHGKDLAAPETIAWALRDAKIEPSEQLTEANDNDSLKELLRSRTQEAVDRGVFGAPSLFLSGRHLGKGLMLWGQDRFDIAAALLEGWQPTEPRPEPTEVPSKVSSAPRSRPHIDFWYDFASPFAYLGAMKIQQAAQAMSATLTWKPLLLGALFKSLGTDNVPLFSMSAAKRNYQLQDLQRWANYQRQPMTFASTFPLHTVTALRLALQSGERIGELSTLLFRAAWAQDLNIGDPQVLLALLNESGFAGERMLAGCGDPEIKQRLRANTQEAEALGVFGVPTSIVTIEGKSQLYWGQDRIALLKQGLPTV